MRCPIAVTLLAAALVATGCKKADTPKGGEAGKREVGSAKPDVPATTPGDGTLTLSAVPAKVGDRRTKIDDVVVVFRFDVKGKQIDARSVEHKQEATEVMAVDGVVAGKIKVAYAGLSAVQTIGFKTTTKPQPLDGKTYLVWRDGAAIKATTAAGQPVSDDELKDLADKNDELGKPDVIEALLAARTWKIGDTYQLTAGELARVKARNDDPSKLAPTEMSFTLRSFDATQAIFALTTTLVKTKDKDQLTFTMTGTALVELPSSRGTSVEMTGALTGTVNGMPTTGTMTSKTGYTY